MAIQNSQSKQLTLAGKQYFEKKYILNFFQVKIFFFFLQIFQFLAFPRDLSVYNGAFPFLPSKPATMAKFY